MKPSVFPGNAQRYDIGTFTFGSTVERWRTHKM